MGKFLQWRVCPCKLVKYLPAESRERSPVCHHALCIFILLFIVECAMFIFCNKQNYFSSCCYMVLTGDFKFCILHCFTKRVYQWQDAQLSSTVLNLELAVFGTRCCKVGCWLDFVRLMSTEFLLPVWPQMYMSSLLNHLLFFFACLLAEFG